MQKTAIITGASRGIGKAIAEKLAKEGYHLGICASKSKEELEQLAERLRQDYGVKVHTYVGSVGDYSFLEHMIEDLISTYGAISVLVNNAGISHIGLLTDMTMEEWNHIVSVNLSSVFSTCKLVAPSMISNQEGKIINISSVWGEVGASCEVAYSACKGGMNAFTKAFAKELAPSKVQVNAIACGVIDTQMNMEFDEEERTALAEEIPMGRFGTAEEVADFAWQLIQSPAYLTGQIITLDGGWC